MIMTSQHFHRRKRRTANSAAQLHALLGTAQGALTGTDVVMTAAVTATEKIHIGDGIRCFLGGLTMTAEVANADANTIVGTDSSFIDGTIFGVVAIHDPNRLSFINITVDSDGKPFAIAGDTYGGIEAITLAASAGNTHRMYMYGGEVKNTPADGISGNALSAGGGSDNQFHCYGVTCNDTIGKNTSISNKQPVTCHESTEIHLTKCLIGKSPDDFTCKTPTSAKAFWTNCTMTGLGELDAEDVTDCDFTFVTGSNQGMNITGTITDSTCDMGGTTVSLSDAIITGGTWTNVGLVDSTGSGTHTIKRARFKQTGGTDLFKMSGGGLLNITACLCIGTRTAATYAHRATSTASATLTSVNCTYQNFTAILRKADTDWDFTGITFWHALACDNERCYDGTGTAHSSGDYNFSGGFAATSTSDWPDLNPGGGLSDKAFHDANGEIYRSTDLGPAGTLAFGVNLRAHQSMTGDGGALYLMAGTGWTQLSAADFADFIPLGTETNLQTLGGMAGGAVHAKNSGGDIDGNLYKNFEPGCFAVPNA